MKTRFVYRMSRTAPLAAALATLLAGPAAHATSLWWDGSDSVTSGAQGGAGTWDMNTTLNWWNGTADVAWPDTGTDNAAVFAGAAGNLVLASVTANNLTFNTTGYALTTSTLTLNGTSPTVTTGTGILATISTPTGGSAGLTKAGLGRLTLSGSNGYSGGTTLKDGILSISADGTGVTNPLGAYPGSVQAANITLYDGATLEATATTTLAVNRGITLNSGLAALSRPGKFNFVFNGAITGSGGLIFQDNVPSDQGGGSQIQLNVANTHTGITTMAYSNRGGQNGTQSVLGHVNALQNSTVDYLNILGQPHKAGAAGDKIFFGTGAGSTPVIGGLKGNDTWYLSDANAALAVNLKVGNNNQNTIFTGILTDNTRGSSLNKIGSGTLSLGGVNVHKGGTTVTTGTLIVTATGASLGAPITSGNNGLSVASRAAFAYLPTAAGALSLTTGKLNLQDASIIGTAVGGSSGQSAITSTVAAVAAGAITVNVSGIPGVAVTSGTNNLITALSGLTSGPATYTLGKLYNTTNFTAASLGQSDTAVTIDVTATAALTSETWKGGYSGGNNVWAISDGSAASNWTTDGSTATSLTPGTAAAVSFTSTNSPSNQSAMVLGANVAIKSLTVDDSSAVTLNDDGNALTIANAAGITVNSSAGAVTLNAPINLTAGQTWTNNSTVNTLTIGGDIGNGVNLLTIAGAGNTTLSGSIRNGTGGLTKNGDGILTLNGMNLYQGATTVNAGTLRAGNRFAFGAAMHNGYASGGLGGSGFASIAFGAATTGTVQLNGNNITLMTLSSNASVGSPVVENAASTPVTLTVAEASNSNSTNGTAVTNIYAGVLRDGTGGGALGLQLTVGTLTLSGINTYTGDTNVAGGTLNLAAGAGLKFVVGNTSSNRIRGAGTLNLNGDFTIDTSAVGVLSGSWSLVDNATLTETFGATFTIAGAGWSQSAGVWTLVDGTKTWTFSVATGILTLVDSGSGAPAIALEGPSPLTTNILNNTGTQDFGSVLLGATPSLTFTIKNTGTANLTDLTITKDGANPADFTVSAVSPVAPVLAGGSATFSVEFAPNVIGAESATIHIANNTTGANPFSISFTGTGTTVYNNWAIAKGLTDLNKGAGQDPDNDGTTNLAEFAFNGDPRSGSNNGLFFTETKDNNADTLKELTFTCAVRRSALAFTATGDGAQSATIDGVTYTIEATAALTGAWNTPVTYIGKSDTPPAGSGLPDLTGQAWEYRSFSAFNGLPTKGFLRTRASQ